MSVPNLKGPGVYITELDAFPNSVVPVATAVPAFIGYTPQASYEGRSYTYVAQKITSFAEFQAIYCFPDPPPPASPAKQYKPHYYLVQQKNLPDHGDDLLIDGTYYAVVPDPATVYYFYNSIRLFYENGGGDAYIVSVGTYGAASGTPMNPGDQIVNPNVRLDDLIKGLKLLTQEAEPTLYLCPDATLLSVEDHGTLMQEMLAQNANLRTAMSIFDVICGRSPDAINYTQAIQAFRANTGTQGLDYGTAYYPFLGTTIMQDSDMDYTNLFGGDITQLEPLINPAAHPNESIAAIFSTINNPASKPTVTQNNNALLNASKTYGTIIQHVLSQANLLPPSGAMAGVMTTVDNQRGVWQAPANTSIVGAVSLPISLSDSQQADLNVDAISGKSINAIRYFDGIGIRVWGARTLDGNSMDWKYIPVRRTTIFLEQSCKTALAAYIFAPNTQATWLTVIALLSNFLTTVWKQGGLQGATPDKAFSVACGLGTTMTPGDIANGLLIVTIRVALVRPAEFMALSFTQQMATA